MTATTAKWHASLKAIEWFAKDGILHCSHCKKPKTINGHDPCIANLPGVKFACCGHGKTEGYVAFENGTVLRGTFDHMPIPWGWRKIAGAFARDASRAEGLDIPVDLEE